MAPRRACALDLQPLTVRDSTACNVAHCALACEVNGRPPRHHRGVSWDGWITHTERRDRSTRFRHCAARFAGQKQQSWWDAHSVMERVQRIAASTRTSDQLKWQSVRGRSASAALELMESDDPHDDDTKRETQKCTKGENAKEREACMAA
jgi:hypothetical protein